MRKKKVWRYYCDHCKKSGCSKHWIEKHERHCTGNPSRVCRMCEEPSDKFRIAIASFVMSGGTRVQDRPFNGSLSKDEFEKLCDSVDGCPACILALIRQTNRFPEEHWDYRSAVDQWFKKKDAGELRASLHQGKL